MCHPAVDWALKKQLSIYGLCLTMSGCLLGGVYVSCIYRMPGGVIIVGDSGLCCCGPAFNVMCDVNGLSAISSHCLLILQKRSRPHSVLD